MRDTSTSTIAQLLFAKQPRLNFAHMVSEMDSALSRCPAQKRSLTWDCEDIAIFDLDGARIILGHADSLGGGHGACLTASVGPAPGCGTDSPLLRRSEAMCRLIAERIHVRYQADAILWHQSDAPVTSDLLDAMLDDLPPLADILHGPSPAVPQTDRPTSAVAEKAVETGLPANDVPDLPLIAAVELNRVRAALYPDGTPWQAPLDVPARSATPMRLAVHTMNMTLIMVSLPVGAAMLTYSLLRGEDMRMTGRAMALTGAALAFSQSQIGQAFMAMI
jgi:hypothetical protein